MRPDQTVPKLVEIPPRLDDPALFINRDLSLLEFQRRVLEEARDPANPLLERVKFLSIVGSNLDEFFMVRVAGRKQQIAAGIVELGPDGKSPAAQLRVIREEVSRLLQDARRFLDEGLLPELASAGIHVDPYLSLSETEKAHTHRFFRDEVLPILTPLAHDPMRPFPHIGNLSLNLAVRLRDLNGKTQFAFVKIPETLPQLVRASGRGRTVKLVWLEQLVQAHLDELFHGHQLLESSAFRVTRDAELDIQQWEAIDLLDRVEESVRRRHFGTVARLAVEHNMPEESLAILTSNLKNVEPADVYRLPSPLGLRRLFELWKLDREELHDPPFYPRSPKSLRTPATDLFQAAKRGDILLHHPFESFETVVSFIEQAAEDEAVQAIKMTLYRVGPQSPIVNALLHAKRRGKQVAVVVELMARFDEESNIGWARALESAGIHVIYGLTDYKVHAKIALVVRKEGRKLVRYVHLSSGNYNIVTSRIYTDIGVITARAHLGAAAGDLFNFLTGHSAKTDFRKLLVAPVKIRERMRRLIRREIAHAAMGSPARLIFKMNALVDKEMIQLLYMASQAGVEVDLLVRAMCCLRPGIPGISDNIRVTSIVGRFLEHSRVYYFLNAGEDELYLGSADLMPRNLDRRVEVLFPVEDHKIATRLRDEILATYLDDNVKARRLAADGTYSRLTGNMPFNSQDALLAGESRRG
ncbi:MAG: polyphosphate kinase 1 [Acidimicrobiia bacterium]|nr:polyphosphate kinase 1 [Acidimicrobiia bacterium]